jgi:hypothetical protein
MQLVIEHGYTMHDKSCSNFVFEMHASNIARPGQDR